jgi:hypothetical protein
MPKGSHRVYSGKTTGQWLKAGIEKDALVSDEEGNEYYWDGHHFRTDIPRKSGKSGKSGVSGAKTPWNVLKKTDSWAKIVDARKGLGGTAAHDAAAAELVKQLRGNFVYLSRQRARLGKRGTGVQLVKQFPPTTDLKAVCKKSALFLRRKRLSSSSWSSEIC